MVRAGSLVLKAGPAVVLKIVLRAAWSWGRVAGRIWGVAVVGDISGGDFAVWKRVRTAMGLVCAGV